MKKYRSRKALIEDIEAISNTEAYIRAKLLNQGISIMVFRESIKAQCDYIDVSYNATTKILSGRPVYLLSEYKRSLQEDDDSGIFGTLESLDSHISKKRVSLQHLHHWFDGLAADSYISQGFNTLQIPDFLYFLAPGSFKECEVKHNLGVPTHLLIQLTRAGLKVGENCKVSLVKTGSFGLNELVKTVTYSASERESIEYIAYQSLFRTDEYIRVYIDRLTVVRENKEIEFINNFYYKKFYNSADELIICLLLAYYNIIVTTPVTLGLLDTYKKIDEIE